MSEPRRPRVFDPGDPAVVEEPPESAEPDTAAPAADGSPTVRPTLAELGQRGLRWGTLLVVALAGAALLGIGAWFARLVSAALVRDDWVGWTALALLSIAALAALMLLLRELVGFSRLARLNRVRTDITRALADRDLKRERKAARRLAALYARRPEQAWSVRRFREHARDVHDPGELLALADRMMVAPLDAQARRLITRSAKRVATVTALSPMVFIAVGYVLSRTCACCAALPPSTAAAPASSACCGWRSWSSPTSSPQAAWRSPTTCSASSSARTSCAASPAAWAKAPSTARSPPASASRQ